MPTVLLLVHPRRARHFGMPPLLIGMAVVVFGTVAPEMLVSALAASQGNLGIALGNAYGSNITKTALTLGVTALISPIAVHSQGLRKELPILMAATVLAAWQIWDGTITRLDAVGSAYLIEGHWELGDLGGQRTAAERLSQ